MTGKKFTRDLLDLFLLIWCGSALLLSLATLSAYFVLPVAIIIKGESSFIHWFMIIHAITGLSYLNYEEENTNNVYKNN